MSKTLVCIISKQNIPNYLFIKDFYEEDDELLFFVSGTYREPLTYLLAALNMEVSEDNIVSLSEENYVVMKSQVTRIIDEKKTYWINTTGGTKFMSSAVQEAFQNANAKTDFFYEPNPKNVYCKLSGEQIPVNYKISIREYMTASKMVDFTVKECCKPKEYTLHFFKYFTESLTKQDIDVLEKIRINFRQQKCEIEDLNKVNLKPTSLITSPGKKNEKRYAFKRIQGIVKFLKRVDFSFAEENKLNKYEIEYLTGGWFEEYMYHLIAKKITPDDIQLGVVVRQGEKTNQNDLDVVFTKGNKLFVIECKTGITAVADKTETGMFKEIAYKAASIRASLLGGLSEKSMICSLSNSKDTFKKTAKNMGITYYDKRYFVNEENQKEFINDIIKQANLN